MAQITMLQLENYRSIEGPVRVHFASNSPLALVGENNAGKSNIVKALQLLLGPIWPGSHDPEDHEFFDRDRERRIRLIAQFHEDAQFGDRYTQINWVYDPLEPGADYRGYPHPYGRVDEGGYINSNDRDSCVCVTLEAERNLKYQLSYASKYTLLSKLMHRFHKTLSSNYETRSDLEGLFQNIKAKFAEIPEFAAFTRHLRSQLGDFITSMTHQLEVDFEAYNPANFFHALKLQAQQEGIARTLEEMGTGEEQILALSFAYAYAQAFHGGIVLVVEEPEAHLHPLAQQWLARRLDTMCRGGLQMLITTHSPYFVDLMGLEGLCLVTKQHNRTQITQQSRDILVDKCISMGAPPARVTAENILPFYKTGATPPILEGFFAKAVMLVEGPTEHLALPVYLERCEVDHTKHGIAIIPVGGKGALARWYRLFEAYGIPSYVVFDNDTSDDEDGRKRSDALRSVGVPPGEAEQLIQSRDWAVASRYAIFGSDFETVLRDRFPDYADLEEQAVEFGATAKPFKARWVAERIDRTSDANRWHEFEQMATYLKALYAANVDAA